MMRRIIRRGTIAGLGLLMLWAQDSAAETPLERGRYLMQGIVACGNCHTPQTPNGPAAGMEMAGQMVTDMALFTAYAPNITPDPETGIGSWSDDQIVAAIRDGRRPDGSLIGPPMPIHLYRGMSDRDVRAIVTYLRTVPPVRNAVPKSIYRIPLPPSYGPPVTAVAEVPRDDQVAYGAYLARPLGHCIACHTPMINGREDYENQLGAGGFVLDGPWGTTISRNITPHPEDGIAAWANAEIKRAITEGISADGGRLAPPMAYGYYRNISDADLDAVVAYLRTLRPRPSPE